MEVDGKLIHSMYKKFVSLGFAFGAKRWLAALDRQCERLAIVMAGDSPDEDGGKTPYSTKLFFKFLKKHS